MKTHHILLAATLLLAACGSRHEASNLDTTLALTEDSISFNICSDWYWRNIMAVWVDSTGTLSLNHDHFNDHCRLRHRERNMNTLTTVYPPTSASCASR